jgi:hypothetical protein
MSPSFREEARPHTVSANSASASKEAWDKHLANMRHQKIPCLADAAGLLSILSGD